MSSFIKDIIDKDGNQVLPRTHERAVIDDDGTSLETKLQMLNAGNTPILQAAPTSSTLTYMVGEDEVEFLVGQFCRVANAQSSTGYDFYQLQNIIITNEGEENETKTAAWEKIRTSYSVMGASGTNHSAGLVPDPGATQGNTKFLREDGTWEAPTAISSSFINSLFSE